MKKATFVRRIVQIFCFVVIIWGVFVYSHPIATPLGKIPSSTPRTSQYERNRILWVSGKESVRLNPRDAARRGIASGDVIRLFNDRGACLGGALLDDAVLEGVAVMATGAWYSPAADGLDTAGNPNVLAADRGTSSLTQGCAALSVLVEIEVAA